MVHMECEKDSSESELLKKNSSKIRLVKQKIKLNKYAIEEK